MAKQNRHEKKEEDIKNRRLSPRGQQARINREAAKKTIQPKKPESDGSK